MAIVLVVAMDSKGCIGKGDGRLPWGESIPADMKSFRALTLEEVVVMGRRTCDSINLFPLKHRTNVVLTRNKDLRFDSWVVVLHEPDEIRASAKILHALRKDIYIIGGAEIYKEFLPDASRIYVTVVEGDFGGDYGDVYFLRHNPREWKEISRHHCKKDATTPFNLEFVVLERILPSI